MRLRKNDFDSAVKSAYYGHEKNSFYWKKVFLECIFLFLATDLEEKSFEKGMKQSGRTFREIK